MSSVVRPELPTASVGSSQAPTAAVDNSAPLRNRPKCTYKSGNAVQTNGATSKATSMGTTKDATYPYCSTFANWCLARSGYDGSKNAMAASFKSWGRPTKGGKPAFGAIAVIRWPSGQHHVTFIVGKTSTKGGVAYNTLGGNQGERHEVSESKVLPRFVVALRYPSDYPDRDEDYELHERDTNNVSEMSAESTR
jgi:uncharacterized protein (TIGR02594 family)